MNPRHSLQLGALRLQQCHLLQNCHSQGWHRRPAGEGPPEDRARGEGGGGHVVQVKLRARHHRIALRHLGLSMAVEVADLGLVVTWDRGNRVTVRLRPQWANRVRGGWSLARCKDCAETTILTRRMTRRRPPGHSVLMLPHLATPGGCTATALRLSQSRFAGFT